MYVIKSELTNECIRMGRHVRDEFFIILRTEGQFFEKSEKDKKRKRKNKLTQIIQRKVQQNN